jgi:hypothetical protein
MRYPFRIPIVGQTETVDSVGHRAVCTEIGLEIGGFTERSAEGDRDICCGTMAVAELWLGSPAVTKGIPDRSRHCWSHTEIQRRACRGKRGKIAELRALQEIETRALYGVGGASSRPRLSSEN